MLKRSFCPVTRQEFATKARPVVVHFSGHSIEAEVKEFSTGSLGWYLNGKVHLEIGGKRVPVQVNGNIIVIGSKELPGDATK